MGRKEATVLFSGGSDSTLAATSLLKEEHFEKLHLLTFHHSGMKHLNKSRVNVRRLEEKFGKAKVVHRITSIEEMFRKLYYTNYLRDLKRFGVFLAAAACNVCQLAMHAHTLMYNLQNGIQYAYDGYKAEKEHVYVIMSKEGREVLKEFYKEYGVTYGSPVHNILRTDWRLYELGVTHRRNVKFPYEHLDYEAQHSCYQGLLTNLYILCYHHVLFNRPEARWIEYLKEKVEMAKKCVDRVCATSSW